MKIINFVAIASIWIVGLGGCALPKKTQVTAIPPVKTSKSVGAPVEGEQAVGSEQTDILGESSDNTSAGTMGRGQYDVTATLTFVNDRIFEYGKKLDQWKELDSQAAKKPLSEDEATEMTGCYRKLKGVLNSYNELKGRLLQGGGKGSTNVVGNLGLNDIEKSDIAFIDGVCGRLLKEKTRLGGKTGGQFNLDDSGDLSQLELVINRLSEARDYPEILQAWQKIPASQLARVRLQTRIHYANALIYLNKAEKAAENYQMVVDQMATSEDQATDLISIRKTLGDLYTAIGNYKAAAEQYKKISSDYQNLGKLEDWSKLQLALIEHGKDGSNELKEYSMILKDYLSYSAEKDGYKLLWQVEKFITKYPYSAVALNADLIKNKAREAADKWFDTFISRVDKLRDEKRFEEAQALIKTMLPDLIGPDKQLALKAKSEELSMTDAVAKEEQRMVMAQDLQKTWNNGLLLAKAEKFDEALTVFAGFVGTEYESKAQEKIKEMSLEAAKADRKKAANLYMRYSKTNDVENKKKLLLETHALLKNILVKYPDVEIKPKVISNLQRVEQDMMALDPKLLKQSSPVGSLQATEDENQGGTSGTKANAATSQDGFNETELPPPTKKSFPAN